VKLGPNGTTINPASMLTNVMIQFGDIQHHEFWSSITLTASNGFLTIYPDSPKDISTLSGIDIWYDDLLGNQYDIIWR
jgi:hypothetical protein